MILKQKDNRTEDIAELNRLLNLNISNKQRFLIERELKCLMSGDSGESSSAYYLEFKFNESKNWALIHDLRIEHSGMVAQIDHLLINRILDIHVLETKNYFYGIKITDDGEFLSYNGKAYQGIESPIEQNKRHIELLQKTITDRNLAPTRLGIPIPISFLNYVLVAPTARIDRPRKKSFDSTNLIKADAYTSHIDKELDKRSVVSVFASAAKMVGTDTLEAFAQKLIKLHRPGKSDYAAKFGINENTIQLLQSKITPLPITKAQERNKATPRVCDQCGAEVEAKVLYYCRINKKKFNGKTLCQTCQNPTAQVQQPQSSIERKKGLCDACSAAVDNKVAFFCRMNKEKFHGKILCRDCQKKHLNLHEQFEQNISTARS
ncbi:MAG: NERD domain-containing protein [Proteobacteria bacterium]|nr:NERD domain-containing protein [Pseudomonadota bacterium]MBU0968783.1 NERD domain-containing protein [Pseudomonadota bacterium]